MKRFSVICLQCGLSVNRLVDAETAQTEIKRVTYQQKCKVAPNAADFDCPELERAVERSRRWDPIFQGGMSRPASNDDAIVFPEALLEAAAKDRNLVAEKADLSVEAADLHASVGVTDTVNAAPTTPGDLALDELRRARSARAGQGIPEAEMPPWENSFRDGFVVSLLHHDLADRLRDIVEAQPAKLAQQPARGFLGVVREQAQHLPSDQIGVVEVDVRQPNAPTARRSAVAASRRAQGTRPAWPPVW
jgi:hypothetical protein